jgi:nucleoside-diphosphate-sugar epimerase
VAHQTSVAEVDLGRFDQPLAEVIGEGLGQTNLNCDIRNGKEGKRRAEALAVSYARQYGVEVLIARIFNTYGPRMHENDGHSVT